jgi:hypothetical protein
MAQNVAKYGTSGLVGGLVVWGINKKYGGTVVTTLGTIPTWALGVGLGIGTTLISDIINETLTPELSKNDKMTTVYGAVVNLGSAAGGFTLGSYLANTELVKYQGGPLMTAAMGIGINMVSDYAYENFVAPMVGVNGDNFTGF